MPSDDFKADQFNTSCCGDCMVGPIPEPWKSAGNDAYVDGAEPIKVAVLSRGASFGEMALLYSTTRTATVRCTDMGHVFRLARAAYLLAVRGDTVAEAAKGGAASAGGAAKKGASASMEESPPWLLTMLSDKSVQGALLKTLQEVALQPGEAAFGESSPIGPAIVVVQHHQIHSARLGRRQPGTAGRAHHELRRALAIARWLGVPRTHERSPWLQPPAFGCS